MGYFDGQSTDDSLNTPAEISAAIQGWQRLSNGTGAVGSIFPPRLAAGIGIPLVSDLRVISSSTLNGQTVITLAWLDPSYLNLSVNPINTFNVYVTNMISANKQPQLVASSHSPAQFTLQTDNVNALAFTVQTVLQNGQSSTITESPTCTATSASPALTVAFSDVTGTLLPTQFPNGIVTLPKLASGLQAVQVVATLPTYNPTTYPQGTVVFNEADNKLYRATGSAWTSVIASVDIPSGAIDLTKFGSGLQPVQVVATLPTYNAITYPQGTTVFNQADNQLYRATGSAWTSVITAADIPSGAIDLTKFGSGLTPVQVVATLPAYNSTTYPQGTVVFNQADNKLYRATGAAWTKATDGADVTANTITAGQIAAGTITSNEIAANTITAGNIHANTITSSQIAANTITSSQIAANTITAGQIAAGTITASEIAANTITAAKIAANTITAAQIAAGTITSSEIAANTILAGNVSAGAIGAAAIAAGAVDATKVNILQILVVGMTLTDNSPSAGNVAWSSCTVYYQGTAYAISSGNTTGGNQFISWTVGSNTFTQAATFAPGPTVFLIATNSIGTSDIAWSKLAAGSVTGSHLNIPSLFSGPNGSLLMENVTFSNGSGSVSWTSGTMVYRGVTYAVGSGSSGSNIWIYWKLASPTTIQSSATYPTLGADDFVLGINNSAGSGGTLGNFSQAIETHDSTGNRLYIIPGVVVGYNSSGQISFDLSRSAADPPGAGILRLFDGAGTQKIILTGVNGNAVYSGTVTATNLNMTNIIDTSSHTTAGFIPISVSGTSYWLQIYN